MQNNMKKFIFMFAIAFLFSGSNVFASVWNNVSNDCPTVTVSNVTTGAGTNPNAKGCEPYSSIQANTGDEIAVSIYYHNTGSNPATNVRVSLSKNPSSGSASTHSFYATINSDQGSISGSGQVYINSSTPIEFSRAVWQPNQGRSNVSFPGGQNGSQVISGGVNIGTINPGWNTQGYVIAYFRVSSNIQNPPYYPPYNPPYNPPYYPPQQNDCRIVNFRASDDYIDEGDRVVFYWDTTDCSYVTLTDFSGQMNPDGSRTTYPDYSRQYCLNAYGRNSNDRECVYIDVDDYRRDNSNLEVETNNASNIGPTYATLNGYIDPDDSYAYRWFRYGTSSSSLNRSTSRVSNGTSARDFSAYISSLSPNTRYYFQAVGENDEGDIEYGKIRNFNTNADIIINNSDLSAVTTVATGVTQSSATLNGIILNNDNTYTSAYFEYGRTLSLGSRTASKNLGTGSSLQSFASLSGLSPNTTYYYRIVGENGVDTAYGEYKFFQTPRSTVITPINPTPKTPEEALASIDISNRYEFVREGDIIDYTIVSKNTGKTTLKNSIMQVFLPEEVAYRNSSRGNYNSQNHELLVYLEDMKPGDEGTLYLQGEVLNISSNSGQIATTAMLVYTNEKGAQENVLDTVLNRAGEAVRTNTDLAATAFFAWLGSLSLCFWLFIIILILLAILFSRMYRKEKVYTRYYNAPEPPKDIPTHSA